MLSRLSSLLSPRISGPLPRSVFALPLAGAALLACTVHTTNVSHHHQGTESPSDSPEAKAEREPWWDQPYPEKFDAQGKEYRLDFVGVKGNQFVNSAGDPMIFQGLNIADPDKLDHEGHWNRKLLEAVKSWGANVVRIPVHPAAWRGRGHDSYLTLLDQAVRWSTELDLYVIIDWHSIGNLETELFQHDQYVTTKQETYQFWRAISHRYQGVPTVAFYELFNEPTRYNGQLGSISWDQWKGINEDLISIIYAHDKQVVPLVAGFNWAYQLEDVATAPIEREGIGYVSHPYPQKVTRPYDAKWDAHFGFVADKYPLMTTEIGYLRKGDKGEHNPVVDDGSYGPLITDYLAKKGASWTAWCFHPDWAPALIKDWDYTPTLSGAHFRKVMLERQSSEKKSSKKK